jgi:hypothetical protein
MIWDWIAHWIYGPHSFWGWALVVGSLLAVAWVIGFWIICLIGWCLDEPQPTRSHAPAQEQRELQTHKAVIDAIYDAAEEEVRRLTQER